MFWSELFKFWKGSFEKLTGLYKFIGYISNIRFVESEFFGIGAEIKLMFRKNTLSR